MIIALIIMINPAPISRFVESEGSNGRRGAGEEVDGVVRMKMVGEVLCCRMLTELGIDVVRIEVADLDVP